MVMKGMWRIADKKENSEDFIFKKTWPDPSDTDSIQKQKTMEEMLKQLFYEKDVQNEMIDSQIGAEYKDYMDTKNRELMLSKVFQS